jgi:hypothetical protein
VSALPRANLLLQVLDGLREVRAELAGLRGEVRELRDEVADLRARAPSVAQTRAGDEALGLPAITTTGITRAGSPSPGTSYLCLVDASRVWLVDSGTTFRASKQALLEMSDAPTGNSLTPTATTHVSMWQTESVALLSGAWLNWKAVDAASAAAVLTGVEY